MNDVDVGSGILDSVKKGMKLSEAGFCNSRSQRSSQLWD